MKQINRRRWVWVLFAAFAALLYTFWWLSEQGKYYLIPACWTAVNNPAQALDLVNLFRCRRSLGDRRIRLKYQHVSASLRPCEGPRSRCSAPSIGKGDLLTAGIGNVHVHREPHHMCSQARCPPRLTDYNHSVISPNSLN